MNIDVYLKPAEAAELLRSSVSTLAKARRTGRGPTYCRIGRAVRYRKSDLDRWMADSAGNTVADFQPVTTCDTPAPRTGPRKRR
jgi:excisionase family DNA binding protein